jgi:hypothetical protein
MRTHYTVALSMLAGAALGATAIHGLHAQAKPPVYLVTELDVNNPEAYAKEYAPKAQARLAGQSGVERPAQDRREIRQVPLIRHRRIAAVVRTAL